MAEKFILHIEVFFVMSNVLETYFFRTITNTNVLDMLIENRELININVHNFCLLLNLTENPLQVFVDIPVL